MAVVRSEEHVPLGRAAARERVAAVVPDLRALRMPLAVLLIGLAVAVALALISHSLYVSNEKRVLKLRVREAASLLTAGVPTIQTPLASAAELADATNGDVTKFKAFAAPYVGPAPAHQFVSMSMWRLASTEAGPMTVVGVPPVLPSMAHPPAFFARAARTPTVTVVGLLRPPIPRLGYAFTAPGSTRGFAVYAESLLPANRRTRLQSDQAFSDLDYVLYLGRSQRASDLLLTSVSQPPLRGRTAAVTVPFGDSALTLVMAARRPLAGTLPQRLPWIILIGGTLLALSAAALTLRLIQRREAAERLAARLDRVASENERLYAEQRGIAQTLQHALLPEGLPALAGAEATARYQAGQKGVEIGGDWYDVIALDRARALLVVGDVSGHGLRAAATMASLRYAIHAYAAEGNAPAGILTKLSRLVSVRDTGQLATVLCVLVDLDRRELTIASAGHLPPLLISDGGADYLNAEVGLPVGVRRDARYTSTTFSASHGTTLLAFTDGLVERRGEHLDQGLGRLRAAAARNHASLPQVLDRVLSQVRDDPAGDDAVIVGLRWLS